MTPDAYGLLSAEPTMQPILAALAAAQTDADLAPFMVERAVLFTDLSGFSAHPVLAEALRRVLQMEQALAQAIQDAGDVVIKALGDSHLCLFDSVTRALTCVARLQALLLPGNPFCAGIGWGLVLLCAHTHGRYDVFSVETSAASRLGEDIATDTQILLTDAAYGQLPPTQARHCRPLVGASVPCWLYKEPRA